jgi:hypothetical protein
VFVVEQVGEESGHGGDPFPKRRCVSRKRFRNLSSRAVVFGSVINLLSRLNAEDLMFCEECETQAPGPYSNRFPGKDLHHTKKTPNERRRASVCLRIRWAARGGKTTFPTTAEQWLRRNTFSRIGLQAKGNMAATSLRKVDGQTWIFGGPTSPISQNRCENAGCLDVRRLVTIIVASLLRAVLRV